jgi:hypothetical protein
MQLTDHFPCCKELGIANNIRQIVIVANEAERSTALLFVYRRKTVEYR